MIRQSYGHNLLLMPLSGQKDQLLLLFSDVCISRDQRAEHRGVLDSFVSAQHDLKHNQIYGHRGEQELNLAMAVPAHICPNTNRQDFMMHLSAPLKLL